MVSISKPVLKFTLVSIAVIGLILFPDYVRRVLNPIWISLIVGIVYLLKYFKTKDKQDLRLAGLIGIFGTLFFYSASLMLIKWMAHAFRDM